MTPCLRFSGVNFTKTDCEGEGEEGEGEESEGEEGDCEGEEDEAESVEGVSQRLANAVNSSQNMV